MYVCVCSVVISNLCHSLRIYLFVKKKDDHEYFYMRDLVPLLMYFFLLQELFASLKFSHNII